MNDFAVLGLHEGFVPSVVPSLAMAVFSFVMEFSKVIANRPAPACQQEKHAP
jgi:hypothetical protein